MLTFRVEKADHLAAVGRIEGGKAQKRKRLSFPRAARFQALGQSLLLFRGESLRSIDLKAQRIAADRRITLQKLAYALGVDGKARIVLGQAPRGVEAQGDRLLQAGEKFARGVAQGVKPLLGEIEAQIAQQGIGQKVDRQKKHDREPDAGCGEMRRLGLLRAFAHHRPFTISTISRLIRSAQPISVIKKTRARSSTTPRVSDSK
jgi:hypothetical protein